MLSLNPTLNWLNLLQLCTRLHGRALSVQWPGVVGPSAGRGREEKKRGHCSLHGDPCVSTLHHCLCHLLLRVRGREEANEGQGSEACRKCAVEKGQEWDLPAKMMWLSVRNVLTICLKDHAIWSKPPKQYEDEEQIHVLYFYLHTCLCVWWAMTKTDSVFYFYGYCHSLESEYKAYEKNWKTLMFQLYWSVYPSVTNILMPGPCTYRNHMENPHWYLQRGAAAFSWTHSSLWVSQNQSTLHIGLVEHHR